ncbi:MAG TPA: histidine phosphatase family protein [Stellaceae bacterium]|nr:histidine phosphatase family protein [Stellaceae bacterium]
MPQMPEARAADPRLIFLFRHGETDWNREGRLQGRTDVPLNALGFAQAEALALRLRAYSLDAVVSSDLLRAATTGRIVAEALGVPLVLEPLLRETDVGEAEGLLWPEARARFGEPLTERWFTEDDAAFPGGETGGETRARALAALRRCAAAQPWRRIGVSTHGALIRQLMKHALPPDSPPAATRNTVLYFLSYDPASERLTPLKEEEVG